MRCQQEELTKEISAMLEHLKEEKKQNSKFIKITFLMKAIRKKYLNMQEKVSMIALFVPNFYQQK